MMVSLIKTEMMKLRKRNKLISSIITFVLAAVIMYVCMYVDKSKDNISTWSKFSELNISLIFIISTIFSCIIVAGMFMDEYKSKTINILFTYPVSRTKIFFSKIITASFNSFALTFLGTIITFLIDIVLNAFLPKFTGNFSSSLIFTVIGFTLLSATVQSVTGVIYSFFSVVIKSVAALVLSCIIISNVIVNSNFNIIVVAIVAMVCLIIIVPLVMYINKKDVVCD